MEFLNNYNTDEEMDVENNEINNNTDEEMDVENIEINNNIDYEMDVENDELITEINNNNLINLVVIENTINILDNNIVNIEDEDEEENGNLIQDKKIKTEKIIKLININMDEYFEKITNDSFKNTIVKRKIKKVIFQYDDIPTIYDCDNMFKFNYSIQILKTFAKHYKLKSSGNKVVLFKRLYTFLKLSYKIIKIQKIFRGYIYRLSNKLRGPAFQLKNRINCINDDDFLTGDLIKEINYNQFFSYSYNDQIYGFDMISFYNMVTTNIKEKKTLLNPYNRLEIPEIIIDNMKKLIKISNILKNPIQIKIPVIDYSTNIIMRTNTLFQLIDSLGNYSSPIWFSSLNKYKLIKFMKELRDIWEYRAQLLPDIKIQICPPNGKPFNDINIMTFVNKSIDEIKIIILEVLEKIVNLNTEKEFQSLGAYYVLGALTLVNENAANSLPWLYQSVNS
jgi:hypothetical protein